jgi:hypothetical protein
MKLCETNPIVSIIATQNAKTPYTYLCDAIRIANKEGDSIETHKHVNLCKKKMEERELGYLQMLL